MATAKKKTRKKTSKRAPAAKPARGGELQPAGERWPSLLRGGFDELDRLFEDFLQRRWPRLAPLEWPAWGELPAPFEGRTPRVDIIDRDQEVVVRAELPGVKKEDLDVSVSDDAVTVSASTREERKEEKENYYRSEISSGSFSRTVGLPAEVDADKAKAKFDDGVLELTLPKTGGSKRRKVNVT